MDTGNGSYRICADYYKLNSSEHISNARLSWSPLGFSMNGNYAHAVYIRVSIKIIKIENYIMHGVLQTAYRLH
jgi:hypothetical protein